MKPVLVLTTIGDGADSRSLARALVEARVAACVNIVERVHSVYRWEGRIEEEGEQLLVIKTSEDRLPALREELLARHPYVVPEFIVLPIAETSEAYGAWLLGSVGGDA